MKSDVVCEVLPPAGEREMRRSFGKCVCIAIALLSFLSLVVPLSNDSTMPDHLQSSDGPSRYFRMPVTTFTENAGQVRNPAVRFYASSDTMQVGFADSA